MYPIFLAIHNIVRWIVLILVILAAGRSLLGWLGRREWTEMDRKLGIYTTSALDTQLLLGIILYFFLSPITTAALRNFGESMSTSTGRFFGLEHALYMVLAVVFGHIGSAMSKKASASQAKFQRAALWFTLSLVVILLGMPWSRPLFPGL